MPARVQNRRSDSPRKRAINRLELRSLGLITAAWAAVLLLIPPQHEYPIIDDWIYAGSVRTLLQTGAFVMPALSQANLVGLTLWGAPWARLLGFSFTTLTYSTLFLALLGLFAFYGIARVLNVPVWGALLGTGLLFFNPLFLHLSYSFMTDVPFLALALIACFCYLMGLQGNQAAWLWIGGFFAGWAFLVRQFGLFIPISFLAYLMLVGLLERRWRRPEIIGMVVMPLIIIVGWYIWSRGTPPSPASVEASKQTASFLFKQNWPLIFLTRSLTLLPLVGLFAWSAIKIHRSRLWLVAAWAVLLLWLIYGVAAAAPPVQIIAQPFTAYIGPLSLQMPLQLFTFGVWGSILRVEGINFFNYRQEPIWSSGAWWALWALGMALAVPLLAKVTEALWGWLKALCKRPGAHLSPIMGFYLVGLLTFAVSVGYLAALFDRYALAFIPFVILFIIRGSRAWGRAAWAYSVVALVLIAAFSLLAKADQVDHDNARWQAAQWLKARSGRLHAGYDWDNWVGNVSADYAITDILDPGFRKEQEFPYLSRLEGFVTRQVIAESKANMPPLPQR